MPSRQQWEHGPLERLTYRTLFFDGNKISGKTVPLFKDKAPYVENSV